MSRSTSKKILIVTGSSGGHIYPALSFINALRSRYNDKADILLVLPKRNILKIKENPGCQLRFITVPPVRFGFGFENIAALFELLKSFLRFVFLLLEFKPDTVVGFGSLISVPALMGAWFFRIDTLIHEQNVVPGRANRLLSWFSNKIAISFKETAQYLKHAQDKLVYTGNPIRTELVKMDKKKASDFFGFDTGKLIILVMGGSQGSHKINIEFLKCMQASFNNDKLQVIHLAGAADFLFLQGEYQKLNLKVKVFDYLEEMQYAYSASDVVLSRAGALSTTEIAYYGIPAILIPYPHAYQHQLSNADILRKSGSATVINEDTFNAQALAGVISGFIADPGQLQLMHSGYRDFLPGDNAAELLVNAVI